MTSLHRDTNRSQIEGFLHKKEGFNKWIKYWAVLRQYDLCFYEEKDTKNGTQTSLIGWIELTETTICTLGNRKRSGAPFYIDKGNKRYLLKSCCAISRDQWVKAIEGAIFKLTLYSSLEAPVFTAKKAPVLTFHDPHKKSSTTLRPAKNRFCDNLVLMTEKMNLTKSHESELLSNQQENDYAELTPPYRSHGDEERENNMADINAMTQSSSTVSLSNKYQMKRHNSLLNIVMGNSNATKVHLNHNGGNGVNRTLVLNACAKEEFKRLIND